MIDALTKNLLPVTVKRISPKFFNGKMENFLTCLNLSLFIKEKFLNDNAVKFFQETSLDAIQLTLQSGINIGEYLLLLSEMPKILRMNYPAVEKIRQSCITLMPQLLMFFQGRGKWQEFNELNYTFDMLKSFEK